MSFLDNSGDIILDAVLTDTGRFRLAKGNGSFKITKFAFGDDEINYSLYEKDHVSGSAYHDLKILQTPILEAFTNNASSMHSKLVSIPKTNLLFMPVAVLNTSMAPTCEATNFTNMFVVCCDTTTEDKYRTGALDSAGNSKGVLMGVRPGGQSSAADPASDVGDPPSLYHGIQLDQGLDTTKISQAFSIDPDLKENQWIVQMDNRLGRLVTTNGTPTPVNFIDDDNIATYYLSKASGGAYVGDIAGTTWSAWSATNSSYTGTPIRGPVGTYVRFKIAASVSLNTSTYLFSTLGGGQPATLTLPDGATTGTVRFIDSTIKVTGATTGYSVSIPVRYIRLI